MLHVCIYICRVEYMCTWYVYVEYILVTNLTYRNSQRNRSRNRNRKISLIWRSRCLKLKEAKEKEKSSTHVYSLGYTAPRRDRTGPISLSQPIHIWVNNRKVKLIISVQTLLKSIHRC